MKYRKYIRPIITQIYPSLGLALRRSRSPDKNLAKHPTSFHRIPVLQEVLRYVPEARKSIYEFDGIPEVD